MNLFVQRVHKASLLLATHRIPWAGAITLALAFIPPPNGVPFWWGHSAVLGKSQFKDWILENGVYDKKGSITAAIAAPAIELTKEKIVLSLIISTIATIGLIWMSLAEDDPIETGSFKLQITKQAYGIYNIALPLYSILVVGAFWSTYLLGADDDIACYWLIVIIVIQSSPIWLILSNSLWKRL